MSFTKHARVTALRFKSCISSFPFYTCALIGNLHVVNCTFFYLFLFIFYSLNTMSFSWYCCPLCNVLLNLKVIGKFFGKSFNIFLNGGNTKSSFEVLLFSLDTIFNLGSSSQSGVEVPYKPLASLGLPGSHCEKLKIITSCNSTTFENHGFRHICRVDEIQRQCEWKMEVTEIG